MLEPKAIELMSKPNYAVISTLLPSGHPQTQMVWVDHDDEHVLVNTERDRQKAKNVVDDPRATVLIFDRGNMYSWVEIRGEVIEVIGGQQARDHIDALAEKYMGRDDYPNPIASERVILKIKPNRQVVK